MRFNFFKFLFNQKLVHVFVIVLTCIAIFLNLTIKTNASEIQNSHKKTILAKLVTSEFGNFEETEELIIEEFNKESLTSIAPRKYLNNISFNKTSAPISITTEKPTTDNITKSVAINTEKKAAVKRTKSITYVVKSLDSISTIADEFDITTNTILWENNLSVRSIIRPGDELIILPTTGISHTVKSGENLGFIANKYDIEQDDILKTNKLASASRLSIGQELIIPDGEKITTPKTSPATAATTKPVSGYTAIKDFVKTQNAKPAAGNKMHWPTVGRIITQYYSWRHKGLDIANKTGTPLLAADTGIIIESGWRNGYGYQVLIDHGAGKKTRYAHASKLHVKVGEKVTRGQTIAAMGSTGWSTGPHIHFEVIINNVKQNPLHFIK